MTDSNEKPLVPNYVPDVGRLVTDRFDFQSHVNGTAFRHEANQIDIVPLITIDSQQPATVQDAIALLASIVNPPTVAPATNSTLGIIQLGGDISGNNVATSPKVNGIQGRPVSPIAPSTGQVLTWNSVAWTPLPAPGTVIFSGDLSGTNAGPQSVVGIGLGVGSVPIHAATLTWDETLTDGVTLTQTTQTAPSDASNMVIQAQSATLGNGGNLILSGGSGQEVPGVVILEDGNSNPTFQLGSASGRFTALNLTTIAFGGDMPFGTGDLVTLINNAAANPTVGSPDGPIIFGNGGNLWVMQSNNASFQIGSVPNPSPWGTAPTGFVSPSFTGGGFTYTARSIVSTSSASVQPLFAFTVPTNVSVRVDAIIIGRNTANTDSAQFNLSCGYSRFTGSTVQIGTVTSADARSVGGATSWGTAPNITLSTNTVTVSSGSNAATNISWTASVQLIFGS